MNEILSLDAGAGGRHVARCDVLRRPVVDGSQGVSSQRPALWFLGSLLLRMSIALAGFYFVSRRSLGPAAGVPARICHCAL